MVQSIIQKLHKNEEKANEKKVHWTGMKVQTNVKSGAEGCQAIICQMDTLIDETQGLVGEMFIMRRNMDHMAQRLSADY